MNGLEGLPTKTLQLLWDNIHKEDGLITGVLTDTDGWHCALGCTYPDITELRSLIISAGFSDNGPLFHAGLMAVVGISVEAWGIIHSENDAFDGTSAERRVHMLKFLGSELMPRNDIEVEFREKIEAVAS